MHDASWRETRRKLRIAAATAQAWTAEVLLALAEWQAGRPVRELPRERYRDEPGRM